MRLRITHVITRLIVGGAQENTILTCRGLVQRGHDVTLICGPQTGPEGSLHDAARATGARFIVHPHLRREVSPCQDAREVADLAAHFAETRPDIVHTHSSKAGILGRLGARIAGVPVVIHTNHGLPFHESQAAPVRATWRALEQIASRMTDHIVCVGRDMVERSLEAHLGPPALFSVVRSGMEVDRFLGDDGLPLRRELGIPDEAIVVGTVSRLVPQKAPRLFLRANLTLMLGFPDLWVVWVGDGPMREVLEREAKDRGPRVRFTGLVPPERIPRFLSAMDLVLMTSLWEGLPRVAVQAGLSARPVVAFDAPGIGEVVEDGVTGRRVRLGDTDALAAAAAEILRRPDRGRSLGREARRRLKDAYRWEKMVDDLEALYVDRFRNPLKRANSQPRRLSRRVPPGML